MGDQPSHTGNKICQHTICKTETLYDRKKGPNCEKYRSLFHFFGDYSATSASNNGIDFPKDLSYRDYRSAPMYARIT